MGSKMTWWLLPLALSLWLAACSQPSLAVGKPAPDFALPTLNGETARLSDFQGQVVAVAFWRTD